MSATCRALARRFPARRALVFGAASGLGRATALELTAGGWTVGAADIDQAGLERLTARLQRPTADLERPPGDAERRGGAVLSFAADVRDARQVASTVDAFVQATGGLDLLVNSAGIGGAGALDGYPLDWWREIVDVNLMGVVNACHAAVPVMRAQRSGQIVNVASAAAFHNLPRIGAYCASKAAVLALSETLAAELRGSGVGVSVKMSTFYESDIARHTRGSSEDRRLAQELVDRSGITAAWVAKRMLRAAGWGHLYIVLPFRARVLWAVKRHAPRLYQLVLPPLHAAAVRRLLANAQRPAAGAIAGIAKEDER